MSERPSGLFVFAPVYVIVTEHYAGENVNTGKMYKNGAAIVS